MVIKKLRRKKKVGLALGSGAARGFASIGVLQALKEMDIYPDLIAGTSMGALVGAFHATGNLDTLEEVVLKTDWMKVTRFFTDIVFPRNGLIDGRRIEKFIRKYTEEIDIEDTDIPFRAISTDINTGEEVVLSEGKLIEAVRASISIPGIFTPVHVNGRFLVDGALVNPVPVTVARNMGADIVVAVDVNRYMFDGRRTKGVSESERPGRRNKERKGRIRLPGGKTLQIERVVSSLGKRFGGVDLHALGHAVGWKEKKKGPNIIEILVTSGHIMGFHISRYMLDLHQPDVVIAPKVGQIKLLEFHRAKEAVSAGYEEVMEQRGEIERAMRKKKRSANRI